MLAPIRMRLVNKFWLVQALSCYIGSVIAIESGYAEELFNCGAYPPQHHPCNVGKCVLLDTPASGGSKFEIHKPGHYCLAIDLHPRLDFADHAAEPVLIDIRASNVTLDLQGHNLGRGKVFPFKGGTGIEISNGKYGTGEGRSRNITVRNGRLQDFNTAINRYAVVYETEGERKIVERLAYDRARNRYHYAPDNILIEKVEFLRNKEDIHIEARIHTAESIEKQRIRNSKYLDRERKRKADAFTDREEAALQRRLSCQAQPPCINSGQRPINSWGLNQQLGIFPSGSSGRK